MSASFNPYRHAVATLAAACAGDDDGASQLGAEALAQPDAAATAAYLGRLAGIAVLALRGAAELGAPDPAEVLQHLGLEAAAEEWPRAAPSP